MGSKKAKRAQRVYRAMHTIKNKLLEKRLELHAYIRESFPHSLNIYKRLKKQTIFFTHLFLWSMFYVYFLGENKSKTKKEKKRKVNVKINVKRVKKKKKRRIYLYVRLNLVTLVMAEGKEKNV